MSEAARDRLKAIYASDPTMPREQAALAAAASRILAFRVAKELGLPAARRDGRKRPRPAPTPRDGRETTLSECAALVGLSRERVRQIEAEALRKLRERIAQLRSVSVAEGARLLAAWEAQAGQSAEGAEP